MCGGEEEFTQWVSELVVFFFFLGGGAYGKRTYKKVGQRERDPFAINAHYVFFSGEKTIYIATVLILHHLKVWDIV